MRTPPEELRPEGLPDRILWNYLVTLGLTFAFVVAAAAISLLAYAYAVFWYLANS